MIVINTGATANDGTGDVLRDAFIIVNENFSDIQSILDNVLTGTSSISISQISGLQSILDDLTYNVGLIPGLQSDINSINTTISTINNTLNSQNFSINDLYFIVDDLQTQIYTKIGEAPIDGQQYVRKDAGWVVSTGGGGGTGSYLPLSGGTMSASASIAFNNGYKIGEAVYNEGLGLISPEGYEWKIKVSEAFLTDLNTGYIILKQFSSSIPLVTDDISKGYTSGTYWFGIDGSKYYCSDPTIGAAVWEPQYFVGNLQQVTDVGSTTNAVITVGGLFTDYVEFNNNATNIPTTPGSMLWNQTDGTVDLILKGGNVTLQIGQESVVRVVNKTATNIDLLESNYQAVRVTGAQGQRLKVDLALATNDLNSAETIGLVTETINNNDEGFITTSGLIRGINTTGSLQSESWSDGDILYLSPTVAGNVTNIKPVAPNHLVVMGYVVRAHITQGTIFVKVDNGYELDELHNVKITGTPSNNQVLSYTSASDVWENKTIIQDSIIDGVTAIAPSQNSVFDALALKQNNLKTFNRTQGIYLFEEFMGSNSGSVATNYSGVVTLASGNGTARTVGFTTATQSGRTNQQGVIQHSTGTGATNFTGYDLGNSSLMIGTGTISIETYVNVQTLSTVTERFFTFFGYGVPSNWQNSANAIFFSYDEGGVVYFAGTPSPNWKCYTRGGGTTTLTTTSIPVVVDQWYKLRIDINAAATSVTFYIDGTLVATHNTNIPSTGTPMSIVSLMNKTIGTSVRTMLTDYFMYEEIFTNPR